MISLATEPYLEGRQTALGPAATVFGALAAERRPGATTPCEARDAARRAMLPAGAAPRPKRREPAAPVPCDVPDDDLRAPWSWAEEARVASAEAAGAALLVLLSCLPPPGAARAAAAGAVVAMLVQCFDHVSGAMFNPTVTLAALVWGRVGARRAALMLGAQLAGASVGAAALAALAGAARACVTLPGAGWPPPAAACVEATAGACLALANCAAWDPRNAALRDSWPLRIGVCVAALTLVAGPGSGASVNPARSFGPALVAGCWRHHWVYWAGPLGGSLAATLLYVAVWRPRPAGR